MTSSPETINISDYTYELPHDRIAVYPLPERDQSKLLVFKKGQITDKHFYEIPELLPPQAMLVVNNTRVIHARVIFRKPDSGARIEIFCLEPENLDYESAFKPGTDSSWKCLIGNSKRWKEGILTIEIPYAETIIRLQAECKNRDAGFASVVFKWNVPELSFGQVLDLAGQLPIPPYLGRESEDSDEINYQTLYAKQEGSVAAPTAGLHFTPEVMNKISQSGIRLQELTLHVGAGTFLPVKSETLSGHEMHRESISVRTELLRELAKTLENGNPIVAVGTTSLRTLESLYWFGMNEELFNQEFLLPTLNQWTAYKKAATLEPAIAIRRLIQFAEERNLEQIQGSTQLLIAPGYQFNMVTQLVTNFHQPNSTLLLLVAAFTNNNWRKIYNHALEKEYRFLSFGDSSLLFRD